MQAVDPLAAPRNRLIVLGAGVERPACAVHRHDDNGCIVEIGIVRVVVLERPASRTHARPLLDPVALDIENLLGLQPVQRGLCRRHFLLAADFDHRMCGQRGIPDWRHAWLAVSLVVLDDEQVLDRLPRQHIMRVILRITEQIVHHHGVGHRRENRTQTVNPVEALGDERHGLVDGALTRGFREQRIDNAQDLVEKIEARKPELTLMRRLRRHADRLRVFQEQFIDTDAERIARARLLVHQHQQRHDHGARPVRNLGQVNGKPARQQHDLHRHHRRRAPCHDAEQREHDAGEHVALDRAAAAKHFLARLFHIRRIGRITDHLQREVSLHAGAHIELVAVEQRPAAILVLDTAEIVRDLGFQRSVDRLGQIVPQQDILRRNRGVGFKLEHPVAVGLAMVQQSAARCRDAVFEGWRARRSIGLMVFEESHGTP